MNSLTSSVVGREDSTMRRRAARCSSSMSECLPPLKLGYTDHMPSRFHAFCQL
ncbi:MAG: hypothetical protein IKH98_07960 [Candidatus Methanomethylophilaceae archaeon]|nr:hypothetical protein [Candidatus Methanomethylophilaceae archaeon]